MAGRANFGAGASQLAGVLSAAVPMGGGVVPASFGVPGMHAPWGGSAQPMMPFGGSAQPMMPFMGSMQPMMPFGGSMQPMMPPKSLTRSPRPFGGSTQATASYTPSASSVAPQEPEIPQHYSGSPQRTFARVKRPTPEFFDSANEMARLLQAFYAQYGPRGKGARSSIAQIVSAYRHDRPGLNKALRSKYGFCLDDVHLKSETSGSTSDLEETLHRFYNTFVPIGNWSKASITDVALAYENKMTELNTALKKKYGKDLDDLLDAPPPKQETPSFVRNRYVVKMNTEACKTDTSAIPDREVSTVQVAKLDDSAVSMVEKNPVKFPMQKPTSILKKSSDESRKSLDSAISAINSERSKATVKGKCACCGFDVMSNDSRFHDGSSYYHRLCWDKLVEHVEAVKTKMHKEREQLSSGEASKPRYAVRSSGQYAVSNPQISENAEDSNVGYSM